MNRVDAELAAALALLGLTADASPADVAAAYRRRARETHPDRCDEPGAAQRFDALSTAYRRALAATSAAGAAAPPAPPATPEPRRTPPPAPPRPRRPLRQPVQFAAGPVRYTPAPEPPARPPRRG